MPGKWTYYGIPKGLYEPGKTPEPPPHITPIPSGSQAKVTAPSGGNVN